MLNIKALAHWVFFKRRFLSFYYTHIVKTNDTPGAGPILTPGLLFEQTL
jgi:hypothetical protein